MKSSQNITFLRLGTVWARSRRGRQPFGLLFDPVLFFLFVDILVLCNLENLCSIFILALGNSHPVNYTVLDNDLFRS